MIINAERRWVMIEIPRTGTRSMRQALKSLPDTFVYGDHNELSTLPDCFKGFQVFTIVRDPITRLHSLYQFVRMTSTLQRHPDWFMKNFEEAHNLSFSEWVVAGREIFCGGGEWPYRTALDVPEQMKSQTHYYADPVETPVLVFNYEQVYHPLSPQYRCVRDIVGFDFDPLHINASAHIRDTKDIYSQVTRAAAKHILTVCKPELRLHYPDTQHVLEAIMNQHEAVS